MIYSPKIANPTPAVASAQVSAQVVKLCGQVVKSSVYFGDAAISVKRDITKTQWIDEEETLDIIFDDD